MATQVTVPPQPGVDAGALLQFLRTCDDVAEQLKNGATSLVVPVAAIGPLGLQAVEVLKQRLEESISARFTFVLDAAVNTVTVSAVEPMPSSSVPDDEPAVAPAPTRKRKGATKVPRPKNAFMIYRLDWHPQIAAQHPGMHNNDMSKIIGGMWRAESQDTIDTYKARAEEEKRQHAIAHPGYQYQPRKPSEKKKRMTKNKRAKLAVTSNGAVPPTGAINLPAQSIANGQLNPMGANSVPLLQGSVAGNQVNASAFTPSYQNNTSLLAAGLYGEVYPLDSELAVDLGDGLDGLLAFDPFSEQERQEQLDLSALFNFDYSMI